MWEQYTSFIHTQPIHTPRDTHKRRQYGPLWYLYCICSFTVISYTIHVVYIQYMCQRLFAINYKYSDYIIMLQCIPPMFSCLQCHVHIHTWTQRDTRVMYTDIMCTLMQCTCKQIYTAIYGLYSVHTLAYMYMLYIVIRIPCHVQWMEHPYCICICMCVAHGSDRW